MVIFVATLFLPYTIDFHDYDDSIVPKLNRASSSQSGSAPDLYILGKRTSALTILDDIDSNPLPSMGRKRNSLVDLLQLRDSHKPQKSSKSSQWSTFGTMHGDATSVETPDQQQPRADSIFSILSISDTKRLSSTVKYEFRSPMHSRKSSLAFAVPELGLQATRPSPRLPAQLLGGPRAGGSDWSIEPAILVNGGLVNAVRRTTEGKAKETIWIGVLGNDGTDHIPQAKKDEISNKLIQDLSAQVLYLSNEDFDGHYEHFCKIILWPVLNYRMPDNPKTKAYEDHSWQYYKNVNQAFADKILQNYKHDDVIWVHDYHLMLVPAMIREKVSDAKIGFFFHTAFPSSELFRCVSTRKELLEGVLGANLVGFQVREYAQHFLQTCVRVLIAETRREGVLYRGRFVNITSQPIGIVHEAIEDERTKNAELIEHYTTELREQYQGKTLIVARDKLDSVRGIRQKLLAYELFLAANPDLKEKVGSIPNSPLFALMIREVVLLQVATSTAELVELQVSVHDIVQRILDQHGTLEHAPLEFLTQDMPFASYIAMIQAADILFISSLREGMGLTAQEFVYCQDGSLSGNKHGPVILSEFTGTSVIFAGNDLPINPWDARRTAEQIRKAVLMSDEEKSERWHKLKGIVDLHTGGRWWASLQAKLDKVYDDQHGRALSNIPRLDVATLVVDYEAATSRLLVLDCQGTLTSEPLNHEYHRKLCRDLIVLTSDPANTVYVTSFSAPEELEGLFASVPKVGLIAGNGRVTHPARTSRRNWRVVDSRDNDNSWMVEIKTFLRYYLERIPGSNLIENYTSLVIDYSGAEHLSSAQPFIGELLNHINEACRGLHIRATPLRDRRIMIEGADYDKSTAVQTIFDGLDGVDFLLMAGDDRDDEPLFSWAKRLSAKEREMKIHTVSLGAEGTEAATTLAGGPGAMGFVCKKLAQVSEKAIASRVKGLCQGKTGPEPGEGGESTTDHQSVEHARDKSQDL